MWDSLLLDREPDIKTLRAAASRVFGVAPADVAVIQEDEVQDTSSARVVAHVYVQGDFALMIDVNPDPDLEERASMEGLTLLCRTLGVMAFMGDDSEDPTSGHLVSAAGDVRPAMIDPDAEDAGEYRLTRRS